MTRKIILVVLIAVFFFGCTRDDICDPNTALTTPLLIIKFKDISNPTEDKSVSGLAVTTIGENPITILSATTDSIAVPLNPNLDTTQLNFILESSSDTPNIDVVNFNYSRNDIYVNRACAFRTTYEGLSAQIQSEGLDNWIFSTEVILSTIENENETHLTILH